MVSNRKHRHKPRSPVGKKISHLVREGEPQSKAVAMALSMKRAHRLTPSGGYIRSKKKSRSRGNAKR
jgi:hypothetical protein